MAINHEHRQSGAPGCIRLDLRELAQYIALENHTAAYCSIPNESVARVFAQHTRQDILQKRGQAMSAQANMSVQCVLRLLKG